MMWFQSKHFSIGWINPKTQVGLGILCMWDVKRIVIDLPCVSMDIEYSRQKVDNE